MNLILIFIRGGIIMNSDNFFVSKWLIFKKIWSKIPSIAIWISFGSIVPLLISFLLVFLVFDSPIDALQKMYNLRGRPNDTSDAFSALSDILTLLITTYGILLTALFSFLVYTVSKQGVEISNEIKKLETSRDSEALCEQALIVFHEFQRNIIHLRDLYINGVSENKIQSLLKHFHFSEDWIRNIAKLRSGLTTTELERLYDIYNEFNMLKKLLEGDAPLIDVKKHVTNMSDKLFTKALPNYLINEFTSLSAEHIINNNYFIILHKIYYMTFSPLQVQSQSGETKLNDIIHEKKTDDQHFLYTSDGLLKLVLCTVRERNKVQKIYGYNKSKEVVYSLEQLEKKSSRSKYTFIRDEKYPINQSTKPYYTHFFDGEIVDRKIINGVFTKFNRKGTIKFRGCTDGNGNATEGVQYDNNGDKLFEGSIKNSKRLIGDLYENDFVVFSGIFKNNQPWEGEAFGLSSPRDQVIDFHGSIVEGKVHQGSGFQFKQNNLGETYQERFNYQEYGEDENFYIPHHPYDDNGHLEDDAYINELLRDNYGDWEDYLAADWVSGQVHLHSDEEQNIKVIKS